MTERPFLVSKCHVWAGLWNRRMLEDCLPGWATGQREERHPLCEVSAVDRDLYECKRPDAALSELTLLFREIKLYI